MEYEKNIKNEEKKLFDILIFSRNNIKYIFFSFLIFFTYSIIIFDAVYRISEFLKIIFLQLNFQEKKLFPLQFYKLRKLLESRVS